MQTPFSFLQTVVFVHQRTACSFLVMLLLGWAKGLRHYRSIAQLWWPLLPRGDFWGLGVLSLQDSLRSSTHEGVPGWLTHPWETLFLWNSKEKKCCLYETPYIAAPIRVLGNVIAKFYALCATSYRRTYKSQNFFWFMSDTFCKRHVLLFWDSYVKFLKGDLQAKVVPKRTTYCVTWGVSQGVPSSVSTSRLRSDSSSWERASGTQKNKMTTRKGTLSDQSRLTCVTPTALLCS